MRSVDFHVCSDRNEANGLCFQGIIRVFVETVVRVGVATESVHAFPMYQHAVELGSCVI